MTSLKREGIRASKPRSWGLSVLPSGMTPMGFYIEPVEWAVVYPVNPNDPIGWIRREQAGYRATLESEDLGSHPSGDAAVEAVWGRFLERARLEHEVASHTHGGYERTPRKM